MNTDWNTFFATISQSASGIIAIIAAFLISKLLGENEKQETQASQLDDLKIEFNELNHRISHRYFNWADRTEIKYSNKIEAAIKAGSFNGLSDNEKLDKLFEISPDLYRTEDCLSSLKEVINELTPKNLGFGVPNFNRLVIPTGLWDNLNDEHEKIKNLQVESYTLINKFKKIKTDCQIAHKSLTPIKNIIYILIIGFFFSVLYPLHFMPMSENEIPQIVFSFKTIADFIISFKGVFIFILAIVVLSIFGYFIYFVKKIEKNYKMFDDSLDAKYLDVKNYSKYFK